MDYGFTLDFQDEVYGWLFLGFIEDNDSDSNSDRLILSYISRWQGGAR